nr:hypothetical protein BaRGS_022394 [Batillaria attramentaria]
MKKEFKTRMERVKYVGHIISSAGVEADPDKCEKVKDWPTPKSPEDVRRFLGFCGYYRRFVKGFSQIARPLTALMPAPTKGHRWLAALASFDFDIKYQPGIGNAAADALSRLPAGGSEPAAGRHDQEHISTETVRASLDMLSAEDLEKAQLADPVLSVDVTIDDKQRNQLVLPGQYIQDVLRSLHDDGGHPGRDRTLSLLRDRFFWPACGARACIVGTSYYRLAVCDHVRPSCDPRGKTCAFIVRPP